MKTKIEVELKPFTVPNFVLTQRDFGDVDEKELPKFKLSDIDADTLERLCEQFTDEVFKKAGKNRPPRGLCA